MKFVHVYHQMLSKFHLQFILMKKNCREIQKDRQIVIIYALCNSIGHRKSEYFNIGASLYNQHQIAYILNRVIR